MEVGLKKVVQIASRDFAVITWLTSTGEYLFLVDNHTLMNKTCLKSVINNNGTTVFVLPLKLNVEL